MLRRVSAKRPLLPHLSPRNHPESSVTLLPQGAVLLELLCGNGPRLYSCMAAFDMKVAAMTIHPGSFGFLRR